MITTPQRAGADRLVLLKDGVDIDEAELEKELVAMVRKEIGPIACFNRAIVVQRLPKTRSGKILRKLLRQIADGLEYSVPSTIDDPASLAEIEGIMDSHGLVHHADQPAERGTGGAASGWPFLFSQEADSVRSGGRCPI